MRKALLVGIDNYPQCPLDGCCKDVDGVEGVLSRNGDGSINFDTKKALNVRTKGELRMLVEDCFSGDTDVALLYYSGHGYIDEVGGYLVTPDFSQFDPGLSLQDVLTIANNSKCKDKIIILDSCHSGFMGNVPTVGQNTAVINEGVTILTASTQTESAMEINGHGVFTSLLIDALKGGAADVLGNISPGSIYSYIDKALGPWSQRPVFKTNVKRFTSLRNVKPQVDINTIRRICELFPSPDTLLPINPSFEPTNDPSVVHELVEPYACAENTRIFADLQELEGVGLVRPINEQHMYFAAMHSQSCALTSAGKQYWHLVHKNLI